MADEKELAAWRASLEPTDAEFMRELASDELTHYRMGNATPDFVKAIKDRWRSKQIPEEPQSSPPGNPMDGVIPALRAGKPKLKPKPAHLSQDEQQHKSEDKARILRAAKEADKSTQPPQGFQFRKNAQGRPEIQPHPLPESDEDRRLRKREELVRREERLASDRWFEERGRKWTNLFKDAGLEPVGIFGDPPDQPEQEKPNTPPSNFSVFIQRACAFVATGIAWWLFEEYGVPRWLGLLTIAVCLIIIVSVRWLEKTKQRRTAFIIGLLLYVVAALLIAVWFREPKAAGVAAVSQSPSLQTAHPPKTEEPQSALLKSSPSPSVAQSKAQNPDIERLQALNGITVRGNRPSRLDILMHEAGYRGTTWMAVLIVASAEPNTVEIIVGTRIEGVTGARPAFTPLGKLYASDYYTFPGGENTERVYIFAEQGDATIDVTFRPRR